MLPVGTVTNAKPMELQEIDAADGDCSWHQKLALNQEAAAED